MTIEEINNEIISIQKYLDDANRELIRLQSMNEDDLSPAVSQQMNEITNSISLLVEQLESFVDQI